MGNSINKLRLLNGDKFNLTISIIDSLKITFGFKNICIFRGDGGGKTLGTIFCEGSNGKLLMSISRGGWPAIEIG